MSHPPSSPPSIIAPRSDLPAGPVLWVHSNGKRGVGSQSHGGRDAPEDGSQPRQRPSLGAEPFGGAQRQQAQVGGESRTQRGSSNLTLLDGQRLSGRGRRQGVAIQRPTLSRLACVIPNPGPKMGNGKAAKSPPHGGPEVLRRLSLNLKTLSSFSSSEP
jgi:hypothetical protein